MRRPWPTEGGGGGGAVTPKTKTKVTGGGLHCDISGFSEGSPKKSRIKLNDNNNNNNNNNSLKFGVYLLLYRLNISGACCKVSTKHKKAQKRHKCTKTAQMHKKRNTRETKLKERITRKGQHKRSTEAKDLNPNKTEIS